MENSYFSGMFFYPNQKYLAHLILGFCFLISVSLTNNPTEKTYNISVVISNIRNTKGRIQLDLYRGQTGYKARKGWKTALLNKKNMIGGKILYQFTNIPAGTYGLALLDDENQNTKMDFGWIMPKEGYGFGDFYHTGWSHPHFDDFKFNLNSNKRVSMKVRYL